MHRRCTTFMYCRVEWATVGLNDRRVRRAHSAHDKTVTAIIYIPQLFSNCYNYLH